MRTNVIKSSSIFSTLIASIALNLGKVVAIPTDTVYGIAVKTNIAANIEKLYKIKAREHTKAIPILIGDISQLPLVTPDVSPPLLKLAKSFWPGPLTVIVPIHHNLPENISPAPTLGIRIPDHPAAIEILKKVGPLAVTSANISGSADTNTAEDVLAQLDGLIGLIIDGGKTETGVPSTVVDLTGKELKILRAGSIALEEIQKALSI